MTLWFDVVNSPSLFPEDKDLTMSRLQNRIGKNGPLFAIHLGDDSSQLGGLRGGHLIDSVSQTLFADGSYLIDSYFSRFSRTGYLQPRAPFGMKC
jgi:hypothetical protein